MLVSTRCDVSDVFHAVTYLSPGGKPGDLLKGTAMCDKSETGPAYSPACLLSDALARKLTLCMYSWQDSRLHIDNLYQQQWPARRQG